MMPANTLAIAEELSIYRAAELAQTLCDWVQSTPAGQALHLDLSEVTEMDSAGLQLLLSLSRTAQAHALPLHITSASPAVQEVLRLTALEPLLLPTLTL